MARKVTHNPPQRERSKRPHHETALCDVRTLTVLLLAAGAGTAAYHEGGWAAGLGVGVTTAAALHTLLRR